MAFVFRRAFTWLQGALAPIVQPGFPNAIADTVLPTLDVFGTSRLGEVQVEQVLGPEGGLEAVHDPVPNGTARYYLSAAYWHQQDTTAFVFLSAGVVYRNRGLPAFPFVPFTETSEHEGNPVGTPFKRGRVAGTANPPFENTQVLRSFWVGPGSRFAVRAGSIVNPERVGFRVAWVDVALGERIGFS